MSDENLQKIKTLVNEACNAAIDNLGINDKAAYDKEPINWGDLGCCDVRRYESVHGDSGYEVLIEEAAPDCPLFCSYVREFLTEHGFENVEVRTEW